MIVEGFVQVRVSVRRPEEIARTFYG